jgi:hypothetical protein
MNAEDIDFKYYDDTQPIDTKPNNTQHYGAQQSNTP